MSGKKKKRRGGGGEVGGEGGKGEVSQRQERLDGGGLGAEKGK